VRETASVVAFAAIGRLVARWAATTSQPFPVISVSLMQSHLSPDGASYTRLASIPLGSAPVDPE